MTQLAFAFPGQGSQKIGMLADIASEFPLIQQTFAEASQALSYDMWQLIQEGQQEEINLTEKTQPILLTASVALWRLWLAEGGAKPGIMAGHSLGEFTALVCAGSLTFADAVRLVRARGQFMQTAVPVGEGAMAAIIGLDDEVINQICQEAAQGECVQAVNYNSPGQVVIAGKVAAVDRALEKLKAAGAKRALPLPVSAPFHTDLMRPAGEKLAEALQSISIKTPDIAVVHNVDASTQQDPEIIRQLLIEQIYSPVKWVDCVKTMQQAGAVQFVECGPGKVLSGLIRRIDKSTDNFNIEEKADFLAALAKLQA